MSGPLFRSILSICSACLRGHLRTPFLHPFFPNSLCFTRDLEKQRISEPPCEGPFIASFFPNSSCFTGNLEKKLHLHAYFQPQKGVLDPWGPACHPSPDPSPFRRFAFRQRSARVKARFPSPVVLLSFICVALCYA